MTKRLITSDWHFDHKNIIKFTKRYDIMAKDGFNLSDECLARYYAGEATSKDVVNIIHNHNMWLHQKANKEISEGDHVWHLGDFSFSKDVDCLHSHLKKLKGVWHFVLGNHDNEVAFRKALHGTPHILVGHYGEIYVGKTKVCLFHYPIEEWHNIHRGSWHLHGHLHGVKGHGGYELKDMEHRMDVGIDAHPEHKLFILEEIVK